MRPKTAMLVGLGFGGVFGLAYLVMPLTIFPAAAVWIWFLTRSPRRPATAGGLIGFGAAWLLLIARMSLACASDSSCVQPDNLWVWLAVGGALVVLGAVLAVAARSELMAR